MTAIPNLPPLPPQAQPANGADGRSTPPWRNYIEQLDNRLRLLIKMLGTGSTTVSQLPSAATVGAGARAFVTDATSTTFHSTVAGSGSNKVPVVSDGSSWLIG